MKKQMLKRSNLSSVLLSIFDLGGNTFRKSIKDSQSLQEDQDKLSQDLKKLETDCIKSVERTRNEFSKD